MGLGMLFLAGPGLAECCGSTIPLRGTYQDLPLWVCIIKGEKDKKSRKRRQDRKGEGTGEGESGRHKKGRKKRKNSRRKPVTCY